MDLDLPRGREDCVDARAIADLRLAENLERLDHFVDGHTEPERSDADRWRIGPLIPIGDSGIGFGLERHRRPLETAEILPQPIMSMADRQPVRCLQARTPPPARAQ
ncbi:hypothetical protein ACFV2R_32385 [Streptomyces flaveolus]|uniref:hypothetical protein n=1 Tax=Streptomyces flaveolus TaxID=67297 RepID=UPI0036B55C0F